MSVLIVAELKNGQVIKASKVALRLGRDMALKLSVPYNILVMGQGIAGATSDLAKYGAGKVYSADSPVYANYLSELYASTVLEAVKDSAAKFVLAAATSNAKDFLPRVAANLSAGMVSDVIGWDPKGSTDPKNWVFLRPMSAGSIIEGVQLTTDKGVLTVRGTAFDPQPEVGGASPVIPVPENWHPTSVLMGKTFVALHEAKSSRPDLTEAAIVVSGGRGTKSKEGFEQYIFPLADTLGAAVGATRSAVDSGFCGNELQVGQTGKVVAPSLYFAVGLSGAIQHLAGMKDSKVIVAINKDPEAPIFTVADYGLVADLTKAVPEMVEEIKKIKK